jgi:putative ABC transport system substrate-binding protein
MLAAGAAVAAVPQPTKSQGGAGTPRIGVLWHAGSAAEEKIPSDALIQGFEDLGYIEGRNIVFEHRYPNEQPELFQKFAQDLVAEDVDVIIAVTRPAVVAAKKATTTKPIVFLGVSDPVHFGFISSLARPGGNLTGLSTMGLEVTAKRVELLKSAVPEVSRVALLINMSDPDGANRFIRASRENVEPLGVKIEPIAVQKRDDLDEVFVSARQKGCDSVVMTQDGLLFAERSRVCKLALANRLPLSGFSRPVAEAGALMSYGPVLTSMFRAAAPIVHRILKGAKASDLPVEQPTKYDLVVNEVTARALNLKVSASVIARADAVLE